MRLLLSPTSDARTAYVGPARINLTVSDGGKVGVANTFYALDDGAPVKGMSAYVSAPGSHKIEFWSVDQNGNTEARKSVLFTVALDTTPPVTASNAKSSYEGPATVVTHSD